jgi:hypothetical protein
MIRNDPVKSSATGSAKAIATLHAAAPYELGSGNGIVAAILCPVFVRGEAYLVGHQGSEAATEFQKILDHRGIVINAPIGALAHLGLARAYVLQGDTAKASAAYQDFLTLWKDADPDIPIFIAAKAEYAKLHLVPRQPRRVGWGSPSAFQWTISWVTGHLDTSLHIFD